MSTRSHRPVWDAMLTLQGTREPVEPHTISDWIGRGIYGRTKPIGHKQLNQHRRRAGRTGGDRR